jgi:8-oxo-dGTP pyrophosphatase MutT (NUDIX family)
MTTIAGAGLLIMERGYALCGLTAKSKKYSGIGGKQEPGETIRQTAFREAVEELYGLTPSRSLVSSLVKEFIMNTMIERDGYYYLVMSFTDIYNMNKIVHKYFAISPYYRTFPSSMIDLVLNRYPTEDAEITELTMTKYNSPTLSIDPEFIKDCLKAESILKAYGTKTATHLV